MATTTQKLAADYNPIAWFYDRHWSSHYHPWALSVLEAVLLGSLPSGAAILDVCCGNGVLAGELGRRGFRVSGLDASAEMLAYARINAPHAEFIHADARDFRLPSRFAGALSTFDSLNHILSPEELLAVFRNVHDALVPAGRFVFDLNLEDGYQTHWGSTCATVDDEHACFIRGGYDQTTRLARTEVSLFRRGDAWERSDAVFLQRCYPAAEVLDLLRRAGFVDARPLDAAADLGVEGFFSSGRGVFVATKSDTADSEARPGADGQRVS